MSGNPTAIDRTAIDPKAIDSAGRCPRQPIHSMQHSILRIAIWTRRRRRNHRLGANALALALAVCITFFAIQVLAVAVARADDDASREAAENCTEDAMIVFDASGSMQRLAYSGETRMSLARAAARTIIPPAALNRRLGLTIYGPGGAENCSNIRVTVTPQPGAGPLILREIENVASGGETPLTAAVEQAAAVLGWPDNRATVVVITDGDENCGGDPCAAGRRFAANGDGLTVHVVSFRVGTVPRFRAACLAEETGGLFIPTETLDELSDALQRVLVCPRLSSLERRR
ncbi:MAG: VWA domain-containing protein [Hyphomicrobiaceae bacterium]|nr:VWA domain-containing protein [Hyphomicrobiaceae bacterium]